MPSPHPGKMIRLNLGSVEIPADALEAQGLLRKGGAAAAWAQGVVRAEAERISTEFRQKTYAARLAKLEDRRKKIEEEQAALLGAAPTTAGEEDAK